jgi:hypothetical protein
MSDFLLLGPVTFHSFELPPRIGFGGEQRLAVHRLPGGGRVIDAMGPDEAPIIWSGAFAGPDAADRARTLDLLRAEGLALPLAWDAFAYLVVIAAFEAAYERPNWVPYRIVCSVLLDQTQAIAQATAPLASSLLADLGAAGAVDTSAAQAALAQPGATTRGTAAYGAALGAVAAAQAAAAAGVASAGGALLAAGDPVSAAAAAGTLAQMADANGFLSRAAANLANALS